VENAVAAIAAAWSMGIPVSLIKESLLCVTVPGRMETYESSAGEVTAIVDFAHNGLSFEKMFDTVALEYPGSRVSVVFGTPGGKAFNRRKDMGEISGKRADRIFLVPDDPGNEDPQAICEEIGGYIAKEGASFQIRMDRNPGGDSWRRTGRGCSDPWKRRGRDDARRKRKCAVPVRCRLCKRGACRIWKCICRSGNGP